MKLLTNLSALKMQSILQVVSYASLFFNARVDYKWQNLPPFLINPITVKESTSAAAPIAV